MSDHAFLAPSSAARRVQCPGSALMESKYPSPETDSSREGTAAHELAEMAVRTAAKGRELMWGVDAQDQSASNGAPFTLEMYDGAKLYAAHAQQVMRRSGVFGGENLGIERRVSCERIHVDCWGTPDLWLFDSKALTLHIWDYKFGFVAVDVWRNWQLIEYAAGVVDQITRGDSQFEQQVKVHLHVVQPRAIHPDGPVRTWETDVGALRGYWNELYEVEQKATSDDPPTRTGPECKNCSARHACGTFQSDAMQAVMLAGSADPVDLDGDALGAELILLDHALKVLQARRDGLEAQAEAMARAGQRVLHWTMQPRFGRKRWKPDLTVEQILATGDLLGVDLRKPPEPITPLQAQKKGIDESVISQYAETPRTGMKLVRDNPDKTREVFK